MASDGNPDTIILRNLHTACCIGPDAWSRPGKQQPLILNLKLQLDTRTAGLSDDIANTFSYGTMCKDVLSVVEGGHFDSVGKLMEQIAPVAASWPGNWLRVGVRATKALLRVEGGLECEVLFEKRRRWEGRRWEWGILGLKAACVVGVNPHERLEKQGVVIELRIGVEGEKWESVENLGYNDLVWRDLVRAVCEVCFLSLTSHFLWEGDVGGKGDAERFLGR